MALLLWDLYWSFVARMLHMIYDALHLSVAYEWAFKALMAIVELDVVPDFVLRRLIRLLLRKRLASVRAVLRAGESGRGERRVRAVSPPPVKATPASSG